MSDITLEKIDIIRERTNVSYAEAKKALEIADGNVVDALIYIEEDQKKEEENSYTTKDEFINWLKDLVKKGNVNRIKIKKDDRVILNIPVNAGIAATLTMLVWPPLIAIGILTAGSVEVVNKIIKNGVKSTVKDVKDKVHDATSSVKDKFNSKENKYDDKNTYQYTVKFDDINEDDEDKSK